MPTLNDLLAQKAVLEHQIKVAASKERSAAITAVKALMAKHGLSLADLKGKGAARASVRSGTKVAIKYRNGSTGDTWSGRGLQPKWLKAALATGKKLEDFAV